MERVVQDPQCYAVDAVCIVSRWGRYRGDEVGMGGFMYS